MAGPLVTRRLGLLLVGALALPAYAAPSLRDRLANELDAVEASRRLRAARELSALDPGAARPLVRRMLDDVDPEVRVAAMRAAGRLGLDDLTSLILDRVTASDTRIRDAAVDALGQLHPREAEQRAVDAALVRALTDSDLTLRITALRALATRTSTTMDRGTTIDAIATCLVDESPELRRLAAETLEKMKDRFALHALAARVDDPSPEVRMAVARALGALDDARSVPAVLRLLDDASEDVRATAITTLGQLGGANAVPRLQAFVTRAHDPLAGPAAVALGRIAARNDSDGDDPTTRALRLRAADILVEAVRQGDNRAPALEGIVVARSAASRALDALLPTLGSRPGDDVLLVASQLCESGDLALISLLLTKAAQATDGRFDAVLTRARPPAGRVRDDLVVWLAGRLHDQALMTRRASAIALGELGDPRAASALSALLADPDAQTRRDAMRALLRSHAAPEALLLESSRGDDLELARVALAALADRRVARSRSALVAALGSSDEAARRIASVGLAQDSGAADVLPALFALVKSGPRSSRDPAMLALSGPLRGHVDATARELCISLVAGEEPGASGALEVLGAMRDAGSADRLVALVPRLARRPVRRARLYAALGDILLSGANDNAARALLAGANDPDGGARASAMWALGKLPGTSKLDTDVTRTLRTRLGDPSGAVRTNALAALARRGHVPDADALQRMLTDAEVGVRSNAIRLRSGSDARAAITREVEPSGLVRNALAARQRSAAFATRGDDYLLLRLVAETNDAPLSARIGLADGLTVFFLADERGLIRDEAVPSGDLVIVSGDPVLRTLD